MIVRLAIPLGFILVTACSRDIRLGNETPIDAPPADITPDTPGSPFTAGAYTFQFLDPPQYDCTGSLVGKESDFAVVTRASLGLTDGAIDLATPGADLHLTGAPIQSGFGQQTLVLIRDPNVGPPDVWDNVVNGAFGSGPDTTSAVAVAGLLDSSSANAPTGIQGVYARHYVTADTTGECTATFGALAVRN
jgi:hypothetical protein